MNYEKEKMEKVPCSINYTGNEFYIIILKLTFFFSSRDHEFLMDVLPIVFRKK